MSAASVVRVTRLGYTVDGRTILRDVSLTIAPGSFIALLGANGAGKTTLLSLIATLRAPTRGSIELFGQSPRAHGRALRARMGMIGHQSMLYDDLSARENLRLFARLYGVPSADDRAMRLLERVGLADRAADLVKTFSRGMTQRLSIARSLLHEPDLLLADEPFTGLDFESSQAISELLSDLHRAGRTIIMVHHDIAHSLALAGRIIVLRGGGVACDESSSSLTVERIHREMTRR